MTDRERLFSEYLMSRVHKKGKPFEAWLGTRLIATQDVVCAAREAVNLLNNGETTMAAVCLEDALRALDGKEVGEGRGGDKYPSFHSKMVQQVDKADRMKKYFAKLLTFEITHDYLSHMDREIQNKNSTGLNQDTHCFGACSLLPFPDHQVAGPLFLPVIVRISASVSLHNV